MKSLLAAKQTIKHVQNLHTASSLCRTITLYYLARSTCNAYWVAKQQTNKQLLGCYFCSNFLDQPVTLFTLVAMATNLHDASVIVCRMILRTLVSRRETGWLCCGRTRMSGGLQDTGMGEQGLYLCPMCRLWVCVCVCVCVCARVCACVHVCPMSRSSHFFSGCVGKHFDCC